jgi:hypothetical protein
VPVPDDQAPYYTSGRGGPGVYLVNTYNLPARALYSLPALTLHESAPGHAFQMPVALEQKGVPPFRRAYISAFGEGWALYTERLGAEMGIYETPYEVFGMLSYQAWRASRLVVDTGIHAKGWTREQAQAYLRENTALSEHEMRPKWTATSPGRARRCRITWARWRSWKRARRRRRRWAEVRHPRLPRHRAAAGLGAAAGAGSAHRRLHRGRALNQNSLNFSWNEMPPYRRSL